MMLLLLAAARAQAPDEAPVADVAAAGQVHLVVRGHGMSSGEAAVADALARRHLALAGASLADPVATSAAIAGLDGEGDIAAACGRHGGTAVIFVDLLRVNAGLVVTLSVRAPDGALTQRHDSLADDLDQLHPIFADLARATVEGGLAGSGAGQAPPPRPRRPPPASAARVRTALVAGLFAPVAPEPGLGASLAWTFRRVATTGMLEMSVGGSAAASRDGPAYGGVHVDAGGGRLLAGEHAWVTAGAGGRIAGWGALSPGAGLWTVAGFDLDPAGHAFLQARAGADVYLPADAGPTGALFLGVQVGAGF